MAELPFGTVTFLFTDIEGSTRLWQEDEPSMRKAVARHDHLLCEVIGDHGGVVFSTMGDGVAAAFQTASTAVLCAVEAQRQLDAEMWGTVRPLRVRMGLHTGEAELRGGDYFGTAVNRAARLAAVGHGGQTVLSQTVCDLVVDALPAQARLRDLGSHRLKDLSRPEHVYQLCHPDVGADFPRLRSLDVLAQNLPAQRTSFVGRMVELAEVVSLLAESTLVTLTGSGGCGKTRLAIHAGAEVLDAEPDGVWFADLAAVSDPAAVPAQVAAMFALKEGPGMTPADALAAYLSRRRALLILDNCEHVIDAAASLADALLAACSGLRVLATSRQPLGVEGEVTWRVPSLSVPEDGSAGIAGVSASAPGRDSVGHRAGSCPGAGVHPDSDRRRPVGAVPSLDWRRSHCPGSPADP
jgi:class 3 adenylate cyclase